MKKGMIIAPTLPHNEAIPVILALIIVGETY